MLEQKLLSCYCTAFFFKQEYIREPVVEDHYIIYNIYFADDDEIGVCYIYSSYIPLLCVGYAF